MAEQPIIEKIQKLLRLGGGSGGTEAERDLAMQRAQEMMLKYNLDLATVETHDEGKKQPVSQKAVHRTNKRQHWQGILLVSVADPNFCKVIQRSWSREKEKEWILIGRPHNVEFCMKLWGFLVEQLEQEVKVALARDRAEVSNPNAYRRAFFATASQRIHGRLLEQQRLRMSDAGDPGMQLTINETRELDQFLESLGVRKVAPRKQPGNTQGRIAGDAAGRKADLFPGRKLGS